MNSAKLLISLTAFLFLVGCASPFAVRTSGQPAAPIDEYSTYAWKLGSGGVDGDPLMARNPNLDARIRSVIDEELAARGFQRIETGPANLGIAYVAAIERRLELEEVNELFQYRRRSWTSTWTDVREFDQGTLVIDVSEGDSDDPVWRGSARAELHRDDRAYQEQVLRGAVRAILAELPSTPSPSGE